MDLLNIGCGARLSAGWVNLDRSPTSPETMVCDVSRGLPFPSARFDVVYHSHLLEHLRRQDAVQLLQECSRVLRVGGILRVAVPDLELQVRAYLQALEGALTGDEECANNYAWMAIELLDQLVRDRPGGDMAAYLKQSIIPNEEFVLQRIGAEGRRIRTNISSSPKSRSRHAGGHVSGSSSRWRRIRYLVRCVRERLLRLALTHEYDSLRLGRYRRSGEVHLWMYDRYSLARLLIETGFSDPIRVGADESQIPDWTGYHLDTEPDGSIYKPDSLYMEATKP